MEKGKLLSNKESTNSQAIDFLLIKKIKEREYDFLSPNIGKIVEQ